MTLDAHQHPTADLAFALWVFPVLFALGEPVRVRQPVHAGDFTNFSAALGVAKGLVKTGAHGPQNIAAIDGPKGRCLFARHGNQLVEVAVEMEVVDDPRAVFVHQLQPQQTADDLVCLMLEHNVTLAIDLRPEHRRDVALQEAIRGSNVSYVFHASMSAIRDRVQRERVCLIGEQDPAELGLELQRKLGVSGFRLPTETGAEPGPL